MSKWSDDIEQGGALDRNQVALQLIDDFSELVITRRDQLGLMPKQLEIDFHTEMDKLGKANMPVGETPPRTVESMLRRNCVRHNPRERLVALSRALKLTDPTTIRHLSAVSGNSKIATYVSAQVPEPEQREKT